MTVVPSLPLAMYRNGDFAQALAIATPAGPVDITGWVFLLQVRVQPRQTGTPLIALGNSGGNTGITITDGPNGKLALAVPNATINGLPAGSNPLNPDLFYYDLIAAPTGGGQFVYLGGTVTVFPGVTR